MKDDDRPAIELFAMDFTDDETEALMDYAQAQSDLGSEMIRVADEAEDMMDRLPENVADALGANVKTIRRWAEQASLSASLLLAGLQMSARRRREEPLDDGTVSVRPEGWIHYELTKGPASYEDLRRSCTALHGLTDEEFDAAIGRMTMQDAIERGPDGLISLREGSE